MIGSGKEYASLEGVIGAYYAARHGESASVVEAIREHVRPKGAGDALPVSIAGAALSVADRADTVVGCFLAGRIPTGSEDPYGVRRAANGVVRLALEQERALDLAVLTDDALAGYAAAGHAAPSAEVAAKLAEFWSGRVATALGERGAAYDEIAAALGGRETTTDPLEVERRARALARWRGNADFVPLVIGYKRVANILRAVAPGDVAAPSTAAYDDPAEAALAAALQAAVQAAEPAFKGRDYDAVLRALLALRAPIDAFFDAVMVNVDDVAIRRRRLGLLASARGLFDRGWDLSKVVVEG
jgi:glycyl-tRNA synthetase beta chain